MPYLDYEGVKYLWSKISMEDYPNNETLIAILNAIDETKANKDEILQANMAQNDETASDYVKGRTHWEESEILLPETTLISSNAQFFIESDLVFENNKTYQVNYCGTKYTCVAFEFNGDILIGNEIEVTGINNGIPFMCAGINGQFVLIDLEGKTEISISIFTETIHQIDPKFVPNLPHVISTEDIILIEEIALTDGVVQGNGVIGLVEGQTYTIQFDTSSYEGICKSTTIEGLSVNYIGNAVELGQLDTGETYLVVEIAGVAYLICDYNNLATTASVFKKKENIQKLEQKFVHNADWEQYNPDGEGYIKNRTHYENITIKSLLPQGTEISVSGSSDYGNPYGQFMLNLTEGKKCVVNYDGTEYICYTRIINNYLTLGNSALMPRYENEGNNEPFYIYSMDGVAHIVATEAGTHIIGIDEYTIDLHKLDRKFLPDTTLYVDITTFESGACRTSHNTEEIVEAYKSGCSIYCIKGQFVLPLTKAEIANDSLFTRVTFSAIIENIERKIVISQLTKTVYTETLIQSETTDTLVLSDTITGDKYKIQIQNGQLVTTLIEEEV